MDVKVAGARAARAGFVRTPDVVARALHAGRGVGGVTAGFSVGALALLAQPRLPDAAHTQWLAIGLLALVPPRLRCIAAVAVGFLWALWRAQLLAADGLDASLVGADLVLEGQVASLVTISGGRARFEFDIDAANTTDGQRLGDSYVPQRVRLSWMDPAVVPGAGERWRLRVRLKHPRGFSNPGGFDYERWLFVRGIRATGYVKQEATDNVRAAPPPAWSLLASRERIAFNLSALVGQSGSDASGWIAALSVGDRSGVTQAQWRVLRDTGTAHLMAISGLHIGLAAGLGAACVKILWWLGTFVPGRRSFVPIYSRGARMALSPTVCTAICALSFAFVYAALAGFSVSTRRALVMVCVGVAVTLLRRSARPSNAVALALLAVLTIDPLAPMETGFWLSFIAVMLIVFGISGRPGAPARTAPGAGARCMKHLSRWTRVQWLIAAGTLPMALALFGQHPPISPLANAIAVPWVSAVVVPPILAAMMLLSPWPWAASLLLGFSLGAIDLLWPLLQWLADHIPMLHAPVAPSLWVLAAGLLGAFALLGPGGLGLRWPALVLLACSLAPGLDRIEAGSLRVSQLDVGQGLAVVLETQRHTVVYDTGPGFPSGFNAGEAALAPYLRHRGVDAVDVLIVSHANRDHTGGVAGLTAEIPVRRTIGDVPGLAASAGGSKVERCGAGRAFELDGVRFELLHPPAGIGSLDGDPADNDRSCVVMARAGRAAVLLTGDIEAPAERALVAAHGEDLRADLMLVPHHGSATSSTAELLDEVKPRWALLSTGYRNHFRFPREVVVRRYATRSIPVVSTAEAGMASFTLSPDGNIEGPKRFRLDGGRFWHRLNP